MHKPFANGLCKGSDSPNVAVASAFGAGRPAVEGVSSQGKFGVRERSLLRRYRRARSLPVRSAKAASGHTWIHAYLLARHATASC